MVRIAVVALVAAALSMTAVASGVPNEDSVAGQIQRLSASGDPLTVRVNAKSGPQGEDAQGMFRQTRFSSFLGFEVQISGHVTCLAVNGNRAAVKGTVDQGDDPLFPVGSEVQFEITDNGSPGAGADTNSTDFGSAQVRVARPSSTWASFPSSKETSP